jgi:hypothetical protein
MKNNQELNNKEYRLCPPYAAPRKSGRPREGKRIKGSMERGIDKKKKKEEAKKRKKKDEPVMPDDEEEYASRIQKKKKTPKKQKKIESPTKKAQSPKKKLQRIGYKRPPRGTKTSDGNKKKNKRSAD